MKKEIFIEDVKFVLLHFLNWARRRMDLFDQNKKDEIKEKIYNIYSFDFRYLDKVDNVVEQNLIADMSEELEKFKGALNTAINDCNRGYYKEKVCSKPYLSNNFIFCGTKNLTNERLDIRVYANVRTECIVEFTRNLLNQMDFFVNQDVKFRFKFVNPLAANFQDLMRPEVFTFYLVNNNLDRFKFFLNKQRACFNKYSPIFVDRMMDGVGWAPHANEEVENNYGTNSYGDIVSGVIAENLLEFYKDNRRIPSSANEMTAVAERSFTMLFGS